MSALDPLVIVSSDTHIGPRLVEDLRPYCPLKDLENFDRLAQDMASEQATFTAEYASLVEMIVRNSYMTAEVIRLDAEARLGIAMGPRSV